MRLAPAHNNCKWPADVILLLGVYATLDEKTMTTFIQLSYQQGLPMGTFVYNTHVLFFSMLKIVYHTTSS